MIFRGSKINCQKWASSLMMKCWDHGYWILYQILGKLFEFQLQIHPLMVLSPWKMSKVVFLMRRWEGRLMVLHLILRYLSLKIGEEVRKSNWNGVDRTSEVSPSLDTKMWSVIIVTKQDTFREIVFYEKMRTRIRKGSRRRNIMTMMIVLLLLPMMMMILLFSMTMIQLILYQMRACG